MSRIDRAAERVNRDWFVREYHDPRVKLSDLAGEMGVDAAELAGVARKLGVPTRRELGVIFEAEPTPEPPPKPVHKPAWNGCNPSCPAWVECRKMGVNGVMPCEVFAFLDEESELYEGSGYSLNLRPMGNLV